MSEKRFTVKEWEDVNYSEHCFYDKGNELSDEDVVKLLNSLSEENEQLQKKIRVLSVHLLSDECALTDSQIRKIKGELDNV